MGIYEDEKPSSAGVDKGSALLRWCNLLSFVAACVLNALGSTGKLSSDGKGVGDVSNDYITKITPAGYAFSIWGVIYCLLAVFSIWQVLPSQRTAVELLDDQIGWLFVLSNVVNTIWIIVWVQGTLATVWISSVILFGLLATLLSIMARAKLWQLPRDSWIEMIAVDTAFSIYAGWVTAASIVNVSVALKASGWRGSSEFTEENWSALMGCVAAAIYLVVIARRKDGLYGLVYCWASVAIIHNNPGSQVIRVTYAICVGVVCVASLAALALGHRSRQTYATLA